MTADSGCVSNNRAVHDLLRFGVMPGVLAGAMVGMARGIRFVVANRYPEYRFFDNALHVLRASLIDALASISLPVTLFFACVFLVHTALRLGPLPLPSAWKRPAGRTATALALSSLAALGLYLRQTPWYPPLHTAAGLVLSGLISALFLLLLSAALRNIDAIHSLRRRLAGGRSSAGTLFVRTGAVLLVLAFGLIGASYVRDALAKQDGRSFLFITIDTLRADHLGCYGYVRDTSPNIDALARSAVRFTHGIVQWPKTTPSFASIMTGIYANQTGVLRFCRQGIHKRFFLMAEVLKENRYRTAAIVTNGNVSSEFGFAQGFDYYREVYKNNPGSFVERQRAVIVADRAVEWLRKNGKKSDFFLWLHFVDPHTPYTPPPAYHEMFVGDAHYNAEQQSVLHTGKEDMHGIPEGTHLEEETAIGYYIAEYDAEIRYTDDQIGRVLGTLDSLGLSEQTLIVLTSDHGESLGDHDYFFEHGRLPYDACSRVPLIVRAPGVSSEGLVVDRPVELINIVPTVLDLLDAPTPEDVQGVSMASVLQGGEGALPAAAFTESGYAEDYQRSVRTDRWKLIYVPTDGDRSLMRGTPFELYDFRADPDELRNRIHQEPARAESLKDLLFAWMEKQSDGVSYEAETADIDRETEEALRALGYVEWPADHRHRRDREPPSMRRNGGHRGGTADDS
ncbi:MAG: sulfatase [Candidatus Eisenbacteria bacterium]